jgi:oxygen-independent coproporphyrinogen-3 oxidase
VDDDGWRALYDLGVSRLREAGIERYEVSNFARGGHRSAHNEHYWRARRWVGLGPSAHGWRPDGVRVANPSDLASWSAGVAPKCERPTPDQLLRELLWSTLRHVDGVDRAHLRASTGRELRCPAALLREGLVFADAASVRLTEAGFPLADAIAEALHGATVASQTSSDSRDRAYLPLHRAGDVEGA